MLKKEMLTEHFSLAEIWASAKAKELGVLNQPDKIHRAQIVAYARELAEAVLEPVRQHFDKPVILHSWYRGALVNRAVGGSLKSQHCQAKAADIHVKGLTVLELFAYLRGSTLPFDQLIYEVRGTSEWVHVSHDPSKPVQRREVLQSLKAGLFEHYKEKA
jgi:hypothetical protein